MGLSGGYIALIITVIIILVLIILLIIAFIIYHFSHKGTSDKCKKSGDCRPGMVCQQGMCKMKTGKRCKKDDDCQAGLICREGMCRKKKKKQIDINRDRKIRIETVSSLSHSEQIISDADIMAYNIGINKKPKKPEKIRNSVFIKDICNYSSYTVYLMSDNSFILSKNGSESSKDIEPGSDISHIVNFNGYLHCVLSGKLYYLDNNTLEKNIWSWKSVSWSPENIVDVSVPHDKTFIWVRTNTKGFLFDVNGKVIEKTKDVRRRTYGIDRNNYIIFDHDGNAIVHPGSSAIRDVRDAVIDYRGELFYLNKHDKRYRMMRLVNWKAFYIP